MEGRGRFCAVERTVTLLFQETNKSYVLGIKKRVSLFIEKLFAYPRNEANAIDTCARVREREMFPIV